MVKHFEFADFVEEFKLSFIVYDVGEGHFAPNGKWIPPGDPIPRDMEGIILPLTNDDLKHEVNGTYTTFDRKLYTVTPLKIGQKFEYKGQSYTIDSAKPYDDYADVYIYFAKGVSN